MKPKKTTKTELKDAVDSFSWFLSQVTGGTREEVLRQAPTATIRLQEKANEIAGFLQNLSKPALRDEWLCERASLIPSRLEEYRRLYLPA